MTSEVVRTIAQRSSSNPKTVLAFWATTIGIVLAGTTGLVGFLANSELQQLVLPILIFTGFLITLILTGIFILSIVKPQRLMLGQISGTEYVAIEKTTLGDSTGGEFITQSRVIDTNVGTGTLQGVETEEAEEEE